jgi:hypothetical protein
MLAVSGGPGEGRKSGLTYNQVVRLAPTALVGGLLALCACSSDIQNREAVKNGVVKHLSERKNLDLDMSAMNVEVTSVTFRKDEAEAVISFAPKGAPASQGMSMKYTLERKGNEWAVKGRSAAGGAAHGGAAAPQGEPPPGHPPATSGGQLPDGHPPVGGAQTGGGGKP